MSTKKAWQQWEGLGFFPSNFDAAVYYYPGKVDIESQSERYDELVNEIHMDGVASTKAEARAFLDNAIITHGQIVKIGDEIHFYTGPDDSHLAHEATWVELDQNAE